jgi:hypothetical protein
MVSSLLPVSPFVVFSATFKDVLLMTFEFVASLRLDVGGLGTGAVNFLRLFDTELDDERMEVVHGKTMLV